jgi:hypothetical protein
MKKRRNVKFIAGVAAIATVVAGLAAAGAVAASKALSPSEESKAVIEDAAGQLGIEPDKPGGAEQALKNRIDAAVEAGRLTKEQAEALKQRIDSGDGVPLFGGLQRIRKFYFGHFRNLKTAAYLDSPRPSFAKSSPTRRWPRSRKTRVSLSTVS